MTIERRPPAQGKGQLEPGHNRAITVNFRPTIHAVAGAPVVNIELNLGDSRTFEEWGNITGVNMTASSLRFCSCLRSARLVAVAREALRVVCHIALHKKNCCPRGKLCSTGGGSRVLVHEVNFRRRKCTPRENTLSL